MPQELRAFNLAALEVVDYVVIDNEPTPIENISTYQARLFRQGLRISRATACIRGPPRRRARIEAYGGEIMFTPGDIVYSSSHIIETETAGVSPPRS